MAGENKLLIGGLVGFTLLGCYLAWRRIYPDPTKRQKLEKKRWFSLLGPVAAVAFVAHAVGNAKSVTVAFTMAATWCCVEGYMSRHELISKYHELRNKQKEKK